MGNTQGVPIDVDPLIHEARAQRPTLLALATSVVTTAPVYKAVAAAAPTFAWDDEGVAPGDVTPTLSQPVIDVYRVEGYMPVSEELWQDEGGAGLEAVFTPSFMRGFGDSVQKAIIAGTGHQPVGLFSVSSGISNTVSVTTAGKISAVDVRAAWDAVPELFRSDPTCVWIMSPTVLSQIKADNGAASQVDVVTDRAD